MMARPYDHTSDEMVCPRIQAARLGKLISPGMMGVQEGGRLTWVCMTFHCTDSHVYTRGTEKHTRALTGWT